MGCIAFPSFTWAARVVACAALPASRGVMRAGTTSVCLPFITVRTCGPPVEVLLQSKPRVSELAFPTILCRCVRLVLLQSKPRVCGFGLPTFLCRRVRLVLLQSKPRVCEWIPMACTCPSTWKLRHRHQPGNCEATAHIRRWHHVFEVITDAATEHTDQASDALLQCTKCM